MSFDNYPWRSTPAPSRPLAASSDTSSPCGKHRLPDKIRQVLCANFHKIRFFLDHFVSDLPDNLFDVFLQIPHTRLATVALDQDVQRFVIDLDVWSFNPAVFHRLRQQIFRRYR
jgi:hypothetical protein